MGRRTLLGAARRSASAEDERWRRRRWTVGLATLPSAIGIAFIRARPDALNATHDGGFFETIVDNLRRHTSLTAPVDHTWLVASPLEVWRQLPRVPVPDVGPIYPVLVAVVPLPIERAMWVVALVSLLAALVAVGLLVARATHSAFAGLVTQLLLVAGPSQPTSVFRRHNIQSIAAAQSYDVLAVALLLVGLVVFAGRRDHRRLAVSSGLMTAAALTRYALVAAPAAIAVVALARRHRQRDVATAAGVAVALALLWQFVLAPALIGSAGPKSLGWHPGSLRPVMELVLGWFALGALADHLVVGLVLCVALVAGVIAVVVTRPPGSAAHLLAATALGLTAVVLAGKTILVADLIANDERHFLPVRASITALAVIEGAAALRAVTQRIPGARGPLVRAGAVASILVLGVVVLGTRPWLEADVPRTAQTPEAVRTALSSYPDAIILSNRPFQLYLDLGVSSLDLLRETEASTGEERDLARELDELSSAADVAVEVHLTSGAPGATSMVGLACPELLDWLTVEQTWVIAFDISSCSTT